MDRRIIQFVGYSNSGKTTYTQEVVKRAVKRGLAVATIKHHGHNNQLSIKTEKDADKHFTAGASISTVTTESEVYINSRENIDLEVLIRMYETLKVDCILVEGYKQKAYEKVVFIRQKEDLHLLTTLTQIVAVVTDFTINSQQYLVFKYEEKENFFQWFFT